MTSRPKLFLLVPYRANLQLGMKRGGIFVGTIEFLRLFLQLFLRLYTWR